MGRKSKYLERRAREYILEQIHDSGEMTREEIKDLIRPHFNFDYQTAKEQIATTQSITIAIIGDNGRFCNYEKEGSAISYCAG